MQYTTKVNVLRVTRTPTSMGNTEVETVLHYALPCRINWTSGRERMTFDKATHYRDATLYCSVVDIATTDRVVHAGLKYEIVDVRNADEKSRQMVLDLKRIQ